jgi:hypothetical protein
MVFVIESVGWSSYRAGCKKNLASSLSRDELLSSLGVFIFLEAGDFPERVNQIKGWQPSSSATKKHIKIV